MSDGGGLYGPMLRLYFGVFWVIYSLEAAAMIYFKCLGAYGFIMGALFFAMAICIIYLSMFRSG